MREGGRVREGVYVSCVVSVTLLHTGIFEDLCTLETIEIIHQIQPIKSKKLIHRQIYEIIINYAPNSVLENKIISSGPIYAHYVNTQFLISE